MSERRATVAEFYEAQAKAGRPVCATFEARPDERPVTQWTPCKNCLWSKNTHGMVDNARADTAEQELNDIIELLGEAFCDSSVMPMPPTEAELPAGWTAPEAVAYVVNRLADANEELKEAREVLDSYADPAVRGPEDEATMGLARRIRLVMDRRPR